MQKICVDIGNSGLRCVQLKSSWDQQMPWLPNLLRIDWHADAPDRAEHLHHSLDAWLNIQDQSLWIISSVQRAMQNLLVDYISRRAGDQVQLVTYADLPWQVDVEAPEKVGIDRLLAATAAAHRFPGQPLIVVQAGSAITVDWVEPPQRFCGGAIMPGVPMMLRLLSQAADLLPEVAANELLDLPPVPGRNTAAAMAAGVSSAVVGGVQHLIQRYRDRAQQETLVVISGGDGPRLSPHIKPPFQIVDHLVLRGLAQMWPDALRR